MPLTVSSLPNELEKEPNAEQQSATVVTVPGNLSGVLSKENDWDWYSFKLKKGASISLQAETRTLGSPADVELSLYDASDKLLKWVDDVGFDDARFDFTAPEDGSYLLAVYDVVQHGGPAYATALKSTSFRQRCRSVRRLAAWRSPREPGSRFLWQSAGHASTPPSSSGSRGPHKA